MRRFPFHLLFSLFLILPFAACDSNEDDNGNGNGNGTFGDASVTVSGDVDASFDGNAYFVIDPDDEEGFAIALVDGTLTTATQDEIVVLGREGDRPGPGTYTIDEGDIAANFSGGYVNFAGSGSGTLVVAAESGTLSITSSTDERVVGTFAFNGRVFDTATPTDTTRTAMVEGDFEAEFIEEGDLPNIPL